MIFSCLSVIRQGWLGIPLFFLGIVSLAFSQLAQTADNAQVSAEDLAASISAKLATQKKIINDLNNQLSDDPTALTKKEILSNLETATEQDGNAKTEVNRLKSNLRGVEDAWAARSNELKNSIRETSNRMSDSQNILDDLKDNFAVNLLHLKLPLVEMLLLSFNQRKRCHFPHQIDLVHRLLPVPIS